MQFSFSSWLLLILLGCLYVVGPAVAIGNNSRGGDEWGGQGQRGRGLSGGQGRQRHMSWSRMCEEQEDDEERALLEGEAAREVVVPQAASSGNVQSLMAMLQTPSGQQMLRDLGFVQSGGQDRRNAVAHHRSGVNSTG